MKLLNQIILLLITLSTCCVSSETTDIKQIEYSASTRGGSLQIVIRPDQITYNDKRIEITPENWNSLVNLIQAVDLDKLSAFEAPSQDRFRDAALSAELKIITAEKTYTSSQFDHGNPPKELVKFIEKIFYLADIK